MKTCILCRVAKPTTDFPVFAQAPDGLFPRCSHCHAQVVDNAKRRARELSSEHRRQRDKRIRDGYEGEFSPTELTLFWASMGVQLKCVYCDGPYEHADHIMPLARGGKHAKWNLQPTCGSCNARKGAKTPEEFTAYLWGLAA